MILRENRAQHGIALIGRHRQRHRFIGGTAPTGIECRVHQHQPKTRRGFRQCHATGQSVFHLIATLISKIERAVLRDIAPQLVTQLINRENLRGFHRFNANHMPAKGALHRVCHALRQCCESSIGQGRNGQACLVAHGQSHGLTARGSRGGFNGFPIGTRLPKLRDFARAGFIGQHHLADLPPLGPIILAMAGFEGLLDIFFRNGDFIRQRFRRQHCDADLAIFRRGKTLRVVFQKALQLRFRRCFRFRRG